MSTMRTVLVTGATAGFGEATARRFAATGDRVVIAGRRLDRLEALRTELSSTAPVHVLPLDVRDRSAVEAAIADLPREFAAIDVLVNNAGLALGLQGSHEADLDDWETMVDTNVKGLMTVTRAVLPGMVAADRGHIVNVGSVAGTYPYPGGNVYGATKAFVMQFSLNLRADLVGTKIRVTNIEPGLAETEFSVVRYKGDAEKANAVYSGTDPIVGDDIAETVWWVTSLPGHVNINRIEIMPVCQASGPFRIARRES